MITKCPNCGAEINAGGVLRAIPSEARTKAARENGKKGGRPTSNEQFVRVAEYVGWRRCGFELPVNGFTEMDRLGERILLRVEVHPVDGRVYRAIYKGKQAAVEKTLRGVSEVGPALEVLLRDFLNPKNFGIIITHGRKPPAKAIG